MGVINSTHTFFREHHLKVKTTGTFMAGFVKKYQAEYADLLSWASRSRVLPHSPAPSPSERGSQTNEKEVKAKTLGFHFYLFRLHQLLDFAVVPLSEGPGAGGEANCWNDPGNCFRQRYCTTTRPVYSTSVHVTRTP